MGYGAENMDGRRFRRGLSAMLLVPFLAFAVAMAVASRPAAAQEFSPLLGVEIEQAVEDGNSDKALALIDAALADTQDAQVVRDLLARRAELLAGLGRHAEAAATYRRLAEEIAGSAGENAPDLIPVLDKAAAEHEAAGETGAAIDALDRLLSVMEAGALYDDTEPYLVRLDELAASAGEADADKARKTAEFHRAQVEQAAESKRDSPFVVDPEKDFTTVKIWYATDRARSGSDNPAEFYSGERGDGDLELGTATVSIPPHHVPGRIERPSIWTFDFREDPEKHVVLQSVKPENPDDFYGQMHDQLAQTGSDSAFVFVHGFNVPFSEAAQRTAQMAFDMNFEGVPILFSWPSRASVLSYISDTAVVNLSGRHLTRFLEDVVRKSGATRIHLIAHSMGNRALTDALELYALRHEGEQPAFDQVLFTAPDLDAGLFAAMMKTIRTAAHRITLYASNKDWALAVSRRLHGDAPRAGQGGENILHLADVDSIDMTSIGEDMLAHSYYANNPSALTDILSLFWRDAPPENRCGMEPAKGTHGSYWEYTPAECDSNALLSTLSFLSKASIVSLPEARAFMNRFIMPVTVDPAERTRLEGALAKLFGG